MPTRWLSALRPEQELLKKDSSEDGALEILSSNNSPSGDLTRLLTPCKIIPFKISSMADNLRDVEEQSRMLGSIPLEKDAISDRACNQT